jgi:hypothetical protein
VRDRAALFVGGSQLRRKEGTAPEGDLDPLGSSTEKEEGSLDLCLFSSVSSISEKQKGNNIAPLDSLRRVAVTPVFPKKTKCKPICMPGSSFMHIVDISE